VLQFVHVDHLHRPVKMTNAAKAVIWDAVWQPFGGLHSLSGTATLSARLPGQWFQTETGLHYNWHRSYDPTLGRYTQPDPLGFVDGPSVYGYAGGSPQRWVDKDGRFRTMPNTPPNLSRPPSPLPPRPGPFPPFPVPDPDSYQPPDKTEPNNADGDGDYYHRVCDAPEPPGLTVCQGLLWKLARARLCLKLREKWRNDYGPRPHDSQLPLRRRSIEKLEDEIRKRCSIPDILDELAMCSGQRSGSVSWRLN
jgi:RHS repeat-associated protein